MGVRVPPGALLNFMERYSTLITISRIFKYLAWILSAIVVVGGFASMSKFGASFLIFTLFYGFIIFVFFYFFSEITLVILDTHKNLIELKSKTEKGDSVDKD